MSKVYIFNTTILTTPGLTYHSEIISVRHARSLVLGDSSTLLPNCGGTTQILSGLKESDIISAVGHESTAKIISTILGRNVPVNPARRLCSLF